MRNMVSRYLQVGKASTTALVGVLKLAIAGTVNVLDACKQNSEI
jgi:hypothetical protein